MQQNTHTQEHWRAWLHHRGVTDAVISKFGICWTPEHPYGAVITIPVIGEDGTVAFNKYRRDPLIDGATTSLPKYLYDKGASVALYGLAQIRELSPQPKTVLLTEGELDALVAWSQNIPAMSSTGGAQSFQESWSQFLIDKDVIVCFDNDEPGAQGMVRVLSFVPHARVLLLPDMPNVKDISDYVALGRSLHDLLPTAKHYVKEEDVRSDMLTRRALFQSTRFHEVWLAHYAQAQQRKQMETERASGNARAFGGSTAVDAIARAKQVPIPKILGAYAFTRNKARCLWHNEDTASMHYFPASNHVFCFGCRKRADAIDVYRQHHQCSFKEAVYALNKII